MAIATSMVLLSVLGVLGGCIELPELMTEAEVAAALGLKRATLQARRSTKRAGPRYLKVGRLVRYLRSDVLAYLESCVRDTQQPAA